ncbi:MAG TPA: NAD(P)/FAD-dependent oxidoreductase [Longimicrobiales bacterium]
MHDTRGNAMGEAERFDVVILGGGPAGLSAALTLGRVLRRTLVLDSGEPRNATSPALHNFLSRDGTPPAELRAVARSQLDDYPSVRIRDRAACGVRRLEGGAFEVRLDGGDVVRARRLLLATGLADELPPIEGLGALWGRAALHCPYCHGYEVRGAPLAVLGAGPARVRLALHLTRLSGDVALCTRGETPLDPESRRALEAGGVEVREAPIVRVEGGGRDVAVRLVFADGGSLERRAVFVASKTRQRSRLPAELGCALLEDGCVEVDDLGRTSVPGVYAAGDMARRATLPGPVSSVIAAAASGAVAGAAIDQELLGEDLAMGG